MSGISVALCTYNGEKYIREQIESIISQTLLPGEIILCDDASSDDTFIIAESLLKESGIPYKAVKNKENIGYNKNFEQALGLASNDYIALCDQDDVWFNNKLEVLYNAIKKQEEIHGMECPILVFSDAIVANEALEIIHPSYMRMQKLHPQKTAGKIYSLCINNVVIGMTSLINRSLAKLALPFPENILNHDWWMAVLSSAKGKLVYIDESLCYYIQHGKNVIGANLYHDIGWASYIIERFKKRQSVAEYLKDLKYELYMRYRPHMAKRVAHIEGLYKITGDNKLLRLCDYLKKGGISSAIGCMLMGALPPTWQRKVFFLASIVKKELDNNK